MQEKLEVGTEEIIIERAHKLERNEEWKRRTIIEIYLYQRTLQWVYYWEKKKLNNTWKGDWGKSKSAKVTYGRLISYNSV